jgi:hypothetical protein
MQGIAIGGLAPVKVITADDADTVGSGVHA